jgi:sec-independent protein translocase protein TatC
MTVMEHLVELRTRLMISVVAISLGGIVAFLLYSRILDFLIDPYCQILPEGKPCRLFITDPLEGFLTRLKIAAYGGLVLASPVVLWELWRFVTPGLQPNEKRYAVPFVCSSIVLFLLGGAVALVTFPRALNFLVSVGGTDLEAIFSPSKYLNLVTLMLVAFGAAFEFPILLVFLELAGVVPSQRLRQWRRGAAIGIVATAAIITPSQDPISLFAMAVPMYLFYEGAILVGRILGK